MTNFPKLSPDAHDLLLLMAWRLKGWDRMILLPSKARDELRRAGLIRSEKSNANPLLPASAGHYHRWRITPFGYEIAEALKAEVRQAAHAER